MYEIDQVRKKRQAKKIAALKEKLKALELAYATDMHTIPVTQVKVDEIEGINMYRFEIEEWEDNRISLETPVILDRSKRVIAGPTQYLKAIENNLETIDAVYVDSLKDKLICPHNLWFQFADEDVCNGFGYSLYSLLYEECERVPYYQFRENLENYILEWEIDDRLNGYISALDAESEE